MAHLPVSARGEESCERDTVHFEKEAFEFRIPWARDFFWVSVAKKKGTFEPFLQILGL
jgi:hypothetical protein